MSAHTDIPDLVSEMEAKVTDDGVVWITREKTLETAVHELTAERDFLREMLRCALADPRERERPADPRGTISE